MHDFVDITVFLILGALLSATVRLFVGPEEIAALGTQHAILAIVLMMGLAIALCLCSEADAFVAASFVTLRPSAKLAFLVLGPMLDFKLYAMYTRIFRPRLILTIYTSVIAQVFVYSLLVHFFWEAYAPYLIKPEQQRHARFSEKELESQSGKVAALLGGVGTPVPGTFQPAEWISRWGLMLVNHDPQVPEMSFLRFEALPHNPDQRNYYNGRMVRMTGKFTGNEQSFRLLRFKRNCCAADATPLRAIFFIDPATKQTLNVAKYHDKWVEVTGTVVVDEKTGATALKLTPTPERPLDELVKIIPVPANPYID